MRCPKHPRYQGKKKPRTDCKVCYQIWQFNELKKENQHLQNQLRDFVYRNKLDIHRYKVKRVKIGLVADTHLGSYYERLDLLELAYQIFEKERIRRIYHAGD